MNIIDCYKAGYVAKTHGLKGEVTIVMSVDCPDPDSLKLFFVEINQNLVPHFIQLASIKGDKAFIKFEDVNTPEEAASLKGCSLYLPKTERPKLARGEFYSEEVVGFEVVDSENGPLGIIKEVFEHGLSRHLVVIKDQKEIMIPTNGPFIQGINKSKKKITVSLPEGFLDI
ncbi:MAG TPA: ribosome maturation factor RimM [Cyclobacteriaceae bacterium]|nr:ribosome maturation factor RimM [Cyclobacteriaceae bacterium]